MGSLHEASTHAIHTRLHATSQLSQQNHDTHCGMRAGTAIAMALQRSASMSPSILHIQHFSCPHAAETMPALLQQLPNTALTSLHFRYVGGYINDSSLGTALAQLQGLRSLTVGRRFDTGASSTIDPVLKHVSGLARLTALVVDTGSWVGDTAHLRYLPQQLQELDVSVRAVHYDDPRVIIENCNLLLLDHVTGLTRLATDAWLSTGDLLPASLLQLTAPDVVDVEPLQGLLQLRELKLLESSAVTYEILEYLSLMTQLSAVTLMYEMAANFSEIADVQTPQSANAWTHLPVVSLAMFGEARNSHLTDQTLQQISSLSGLKHLTLQQSLVNVLKLCEHLVHLSELESLQISSCFDFDGLHDDAIGRLMRVVAGLPNLERLSLSRVPCNRAAAKLGAARKLTSLVVHDCYISEYAINSILCKTTTLASLELRCCHDIADAVVPVIGMSEQLTRLVLFGTEVSEEGAHELMSFAHIQHLVVL